MTDVTAKPGGPTAQKQYPSTNDIMAMFTSFAMLTLAVFLIINKLVLRGDLNQYVAFWIMWISICGMTWLRLKTWSRRRDTYVTIAWCALVVLTCFAIGLTSL